MGRATHLGSGTDPRQENRRNVRQNPGMVVKGQLAAAAAFVVCMLAAPAAAVAKAPSVDRGLERALVARGVARSLSAAIAIDLATGETFFTQNADTPLAPASNQKLAVAYTALVELGPGYRFETEVLGEGRRVGDTWQGRLVLRGHGDPTLQTKDLERLAGKVAALGIRRVTGHVVGDASWFDARRSGVGWRPSYVPYESPPLTALVANGGWRKGRPANDPALAAAALFDELLRARGIVALDARPGRAAGGSAVVLAHVESQTLRHLLTAMDADSDNFTAEMVLKAIGREVLERGTSAAGAQVVRRDLDALGIPLAGVRVIDGSGLSRENRVTARELAALLFAIWRDPMLRPLVSGSLAVAGVSGTLEKRLVKGPARGLVRGKTGTTAIASALSGYVGGRYAFAIVQNGHPIPSWWARQAQDRFVTRLAKLAARREKLAPR